jgi:uncharacterized membrane protein
VPGIVLGLGLGGFVDGIVLHQILGWHHMLSATDPPTTLNAMELNTVADGLFHMGTWALVAIGLAMLWRAVRTGGWVWSGRTLVGWMAVGWGIFNLVEGIVDHHILGIHHVHPTSAHPLAWDLGFLILGALLVLVGWRIQRFEEPHLATVS